MPFLSLTTWSLHRNLGPLRWTRWDAEKQQQIVQEQDQPETIRLVDLPAEAARRGFQSLEVCHFNFPSTDADYLRELRQAFENAGIAFYTLLVDYGDISSSNETRRSADIEFIKGWIDIAAEVGAPRIRVMPGESRPDDRAALERTAEALNQLADYSKKRGVRIVIENIQALCSVPENCIALLDACDGQVGMTADYGNFPTALKYEALEAVLPRSESVHAKTHYDKSSGFPDVTEFQKSLDIAKRAGYDGPFTLVYDGPGDMWEGITRIQRIVEPYLTATS